MGEQLDLFEASAPFVGYVFQLRKALLFCVEQMRSGPDWTVAVEAGDDVEVNTESGQKLYQLKHRAAGTRVTDSASDLWKSLRIWAATWSRVSADSGLPTFFLVTTADAPEGSAAYHLRPPGVDGARDEERALELLGQARARSTSKANREAYRAWDELGADQQRALLARVHVLDAGHDIEQTTEQLRGLLGLAVGRDRCDAFLQRLDGWFLQRTLTQLRGDRSAAVTGLEFDEVFGECRDGFGPDNLPIDDDVVAMDGAALRDQDKNFVRQLVLLGLGDARRRQAARDYLRAFTQRSRWVNDNLLQPGELNKYERRLVEEWEARFETMREDCGPETAEADKVREARSLYAWVSQTARFSIRRDCDEMFITTGSYQILADELEVGWHPEFTERLTAPEAADKS